MNFNWIFDILKTLASFVLSLLLLIIPYVREFIIKRYQLSWDKALEDKKSDNERKNYVSKVRFDKEFEIYQELCENGLDLVFKALNLAHYIDHYKNNTFGLSQYIDKQGLTELSFFEEEFNIITNTYNKNNFSIQKYAPFIDENLYLEVDKLNKLCAKQINDCKEYYNTPKNLAKITIVGKIPEEIIKKYTSPFNQEKYKNTIFENIKNRNKEISNTSDKIIKKMRKYLKNLEVHP